MYRNIFVPFDGSAVSAAALPTAAALAVRSSATLHLAFVHDPSAYIPFTAAKTGFPAFDPEAITADRRRDQATLDEAVGVLSRQGVNVRCTLLEGTIIETLIAHASGSGADLIVMSTHGRSGFERLRVGSVASVLVTRATQPLLLVRADAHETAASGTAATGTEDGKAAGRRAILSGPLLVPLDGSEFAEQILPHAQQLAEAAETRLALTAVSVPHDLSMAPFGAAMLLADENDIAGEESAREGYLERVAKSLPADTTVNAVTDMAVANGILDEAARIGAGGIALATHGRGGFKRMMLGSVADELLRASRLPLLVYRPGTK
ncbi:MAG TPA: universal stress protein [Gemmatimonas sp.]|nr:universal stress protein [Gemmatimonas sp.]